MGGADRPFALINGVSTALLCYSARSASFLVIGFAVHALLRWKTSKDPWWRETMIVYNRYPDLYECGPATKFSARFKRPYGFDQDLPC